MNAKINHKNSVHASRSNVLEEVQNTYEMMRQYPWLHYIGCIFFITSNPFRHVCLFVVIDDEIYYQELLSSLGLFKSTPSSCR